MNDEQEQHLNGAEAAGKFQTVQPLRDLESNWTIDLAKNLEEYLLRICSGEITSSYEASHQFSVNFAEAALLLQGSVQVYSRKVEYLYSLVLHALEFISERSRPDQAANVSIQLEDNGPSTATNSEESDPFWGLDNIPVEAKNSLDSPAGRDAPLSFVKPPANLVVLEGDCLDASGDAGELESYLLATTDIYQNFILLDSSDAVAVDDFLNNQNTKGHKNEFRDSSLLSKSRRSFLSPLKQSGGAGNVFSAGKNQKNSPDPPPQTNQDFENKFDTSCPPPFDDDGYGYEDGYSQPWEPDDLEEDDPWKPLNPHEPGNLKIKPFKKVKAYRRPEFNSRKEISIAAEFPLARLHGTISADLNEIWERKHASESRDSDSPPLYEKLRNSLVLGASIHQNIFENTMVRNEEDEYENGEPDQDVPDMDMPENASFHENVPPNIHKDDDYFSNSHELPEDPNMHASLEDLCRSHLDALVASLAETEKQTKLAARVSKWKQSIEQNLEEQDSHPPFDIHEYGEMILSKLSLEKQRENTLSFADIVNGQEKHDVARTFSALLQLINNGDVDLERIGRNAEPSCYTHANPFYVHLRQCDNRNTKGPLRSSKKRAKSPPTKENKKGESKKLGKENRPVMTSPSSMSTSRPCRFSLKLGKPGSSKCTPEGKKRRKSQLVEPVDLYSRGL